MKIVCPYFTCKKAFELDGMQIQYKGIHRFICCPECHNKVELFKNVKVENKGKVHMSKKERLRLRNEKKEAHVRY